MSDVVFGVPRDGVGKGDGTGRGRLRRPRAFVYARCAQGGAMGAQVDVCVGAAASAGYDVVGVHLDPATSGIAPVGGPALRVMMQDVRAGATEVVVVADLDRLSRDPVTCSAIVEDCRRLDVTVLVAGATGLTSVGCVALRDGTGVLPVRAPGAATSRGRRASGRGS